MGVVWITLVLNINLAVINLLPLPVLDGGHMVYATIEKLRGRPLPRRVVEVIQTGFVILLFGLMAFILWRDIARWKAESVSDNRDLIESFVRRKAEFAKRRSPHPPFPNRPPGDPSTFSSGTFRVPCHEPARIRPFPFPLAAPSDPRGRHRRRRRRRQEPHPPPVDDDFGHAGRGGHRAPVHRARRGGLRDHPHHRAEQAGRRRARRDFQKIPCRRLLPAARRRHPLPPRRRDGGCRARREGPREPRQLRRQEKVRRTRIHRRRIRHRDPTPARRVLAARETCQDPRPRAAHRHEPRVALRPHHEPFRRLAGRHGAVRARVHPHLRKPRFPRHRALHEVVEPEGHDRVVPASP